MSSHPFVASPGAGCSSCGKLRSDKIHDWEKDEMSQQQMGEQFAKAKILGFENLSYDTQRIIFNKARMFGWAGEEPKVLGGSRANELLDEAINYLLQQNAPRSKPIQLAPVAVPDECPFCGLATCAGKSGDQELCWGND